jgi:alkanesulfonate monooxygenase SsuD/methylene tetrahydromethanopterin reductase-like flavin-dependent oxidoreductase (luciferase family)
MDLALQTNGDFRTLVRAARWAEDRGLVALAVPDHYYAPGGGPKFDAHVQLGALAVVTQSIELVVLVSPVTFRHPAVLAKSAATLDDIAPGRVAIGIGTGWLEVEHEVMGIPFPPGQERWQMLEEQLGYVRAALAEGRVAFEGAHYRLAGVELAPVAPTVRLVVGGRGAHRTPRLAGTYADEYNAYPGPDFALRVERMRAAALAAGRDPAKVLVSSAGAVFVAEDEVSYRAKLATAARTAGTSVDELEAHLALRNTPRGTVQRVRAELAALAEAGAARFYVQTFDTFDEDREDETMELIGGI